MSITCRYATEENLNFIRDEIIARRKNNVSACSGYSLKFKKLVALICKTYGTYKHPRIDGVCYLNPLFPVILDNKGTLLLQWNDHHLNKTVDNWIWQFKNGVFDNVSIYDTKRKGGNPVSFVTEDNVLMIDLNSIKNRPSEEIENIINPLLNILADKQKQEIEQKKIDIAKQIENLKAELEKL